MVVVLNVRSQNPHVEGTIFMVHTEDSKLQGPKPTVDHWQKTIDVQTMGKHAKKIYTRRR